MENLWPWTIETKIIFKGLIDQISEANIIFPISKYSYGRLLNHINGKKLENKIICINLAEEFPEIPRNYSYEVAFNGIYRIICVGTISARKNQLNLLKALEMLEEKYKIELVLIGNISMEDEYCQNIVKIIKSKPNIKHESFVDDITLKELYLNSHLTVFPSIEEGFGLPIAESIWNCRPCICMNSGAMIEVANGGCLKVDCNDPKEISTAIEKIISDKYYRESLIDIIKKTKLKTWNEYAEEISEAILNY